MIKIKIDRISSIFLIVLLLIVVFSLSPKILGLLVKGPDLDDNGTIPDDNGTIPDDNGTIPDDNGTIPDDNGTIPDDNGTIPVNNPILHINGKKIVDANNNDVILKGIMVTYNDRHFILNSTKKASNVNETYFTREVVKKLKDIGVNFIDIHGMRIGELIKNKQKIQEDFFINYVDNWVNWCTEYEIYCNLNIAGFAITNPETQGNPVMPWWMYQSYGYPDTKEIQSQVVHDFWDPYITSMDDEREYFYKVWKYIANRYKDNPYVMYSPVNEPIHHTQQQADPEKLVELGKGYSTVITQTIDEIRSTGSTQIIFVDKPVLIDVSRNSTWEQYTVPINRTGIVWEAHIYISRNNSLKDWISKIEDFKEIFIYKFDKPLFIGEWHINPIQYRFNLSDWRGDTQKQVSYLTDSRLSWSFHDYGLLYGHPNWYYSRMNYSLTSEEVNFIVELLYNENKDQ